MKLLVTLVSAMCFPMWITAQCAACTPDPACTTVDGLPALCPDVLPNATAGEYYEQVITFYMPPVVTDPSSGFAANLLTVEVTSVAGLPFGFDFTLNEADAVFEPGNGQNLGCATLCGTPLLPGNFEIIITVLGTVETGGFSFEQSLPFSYPVAVVPGSGENTSFAYTQPAGCDSLEVLFTATIEAPAPSVTSYEWYVSPELFSNNSSFTAEFEEPGEFDVSLTTTVSNYRLTEVNLSSVQGGWGSDEDVFGSPDPFFSLLDANGTVVYASSALDNTTSAQWDGLSVPLENPPYTLAFADDDPVTADDELGSVDLQITSGIATFNINGTAGSVAISLVPVSVISDTASIVVFPSTPVSLTFTNNQLQATPADLDVYEWTLNGTVIEGAVSSALTNPQEGLYTCTGINTFGCPSTPASFLVCPTVDILWDIQTMELYVAEGFESYQWFFNGVAIQGATLFYLISPEEGVYSVVITTDNDCTAESAPFVFSSVPTTQKSRLLAFPNPANNHVRFETPQIAGEWMVFDVFGSRVLLGKSSALQTDVTLESLAPGVYIFECSSGRVRFIKEQH
jgi:hypothetical protein